MTESDVDGENTIEQRVRYLEEKVAELEEVIRNRAMRDRLDRILGPRLPEVLR